MMNVLYRGKYKGRFRKVFNLVYGNSVLELCFGDILFARLCKEKGKKWMGYDINNKFVNYARKHSFDAQIADIRTIESLPEAEQCVIIGSLYHFFGHEERLFDVILKSCSELIISEPIKNLSSRKGLMGYIAKKYTNAGTGEAKYRYNRRNIATMIKKYTLKKKYSYEIATRFQQDIIIRIYK